MSTTNTLTTSEVRAARWRMLVSLFITVMATLFFAFGWFFRTTWRRLMPVYWILAELALAWVSGPLGINWGPIAVAVVAAAVVAASWSARSRAVRAWRASIVLVLGGFATGTVAAGGPQAMAEHPTLTVFWPCVAGVLLGWPWWHHLRQPPTLVARGPEQQPEPEAPPVPVVDSLTAYWAQRWRTEVVDQGVCEGTSVVQAASPRPGVTEVLLRLAPGGKPGPLLKKGPDVEVALFLDEGAVGWRSTGKTALLQVVLTERSYISGGVPWNGPTYRDGRFQITVFTDGSDGEWVVSRPRFGVLGGLVVGSTGAGKSRALGVLAANLLAGGVQTVIGDSQNGQSLPDWKDAVEYHAGPEAVTLLLRRLHAEVMHRSKLLADAGVAAFDKDDPRVQALGLGELVVIVDECQLVLIQNTPLIPLVEQTAETMRKTGVGLVLATQLPQMKSLGGSVRLRDAVAAGNTLILRLNNRGSGTTILPDDFVGDPFAIAAEDAEGRTTAGTGYLRNTRRVGMLCRVPNLDEAEAAAASPHVPVRWTVPPIDPDTPIKTPATTTTAGTTGSTAGQSAADKIRTMFGLGRAAEPAPQPITSAEWVLACLRRGPASAQALLDRPDCPVGQAQLYELLGKLKDAKRITPPAQRGGPYTITDVTKS